MKHFTKICLIICGILAALGLLCFVVAACMGFSGLTLRRMVHNGDLSFGFKNMGQFWNWAWDDLEDLDDLDDIWDDRGEDWDTDDDWGMYKQWTIDSDELDSNWITEGHSYDTSEISKIDIEYGFGTVKFTESTTGKIEVENNYRNIWGSYTRSIKCGMDGSTLKIRDKTDKKIFRMKRGVNDATLVIALPKGCSFDKIDLEFGATKVKLETLLAAEEVSLVMGAGAVFGDASGKLIEADELSLEVGAGSMELSGLTARKLNAECGVGSLTILDVDAQKCSLNGGVGELMMEVNGKQEDYDYEIDCGIGSVQLGVSSYTGLGTSKNINNGADWEMDIDCGIGQVVVSFQE